MLQRYVIAFLLVIVCTLSVLGDTLKLNDGTSITGRVIDQGDKYWVKDANGQSHFIDKTAVQSWIKESDDAASPSISSGGTGSKPYAGSSSYANVKFKADHCDTPVAAVGLWQAFIDSKPAAADLTAANAELKHWQEILDGDGEKVNGKWVWGAERKKLIKHVKQLIAEGNQALNNNQTLVGIAKFEQAVKEYPNNFEANFELGYFNLVKGVDGGRNNAKIDAGIKSLEIAANLRPNSAATLSDLAIGYSFRQKYQLSVQTAYKAAKIEDSQPIVQNLVNSIAWAPPGMQNNSNIKPIMQETLLLASKYGISSQAANWVWVRPTPPAKGRVQSEDDNGETAKGPPGIMGNGSGFFISSDGYIMTNRHVAKEGDYLVVRLGDGTTELAERTVVDDEIDMAVIKIKASRPMPFIQIAAYDHPPIGADVAVFGYPMFGMFGLKSSVKMTRGIVTAWDKDNELCDITVDAQVNPGNSGGPMVDHHGNLLAITSMKTFSYTSAGMDISSYGLGYSPERIRIFLKKQHDKLAPAHLVPGDKDGPILSNEELATRISPATVCILVCRGTPPKSDALGHVTLEDKRAGEER